MKTELDVLEQLKKVIEEQLNGYIVDKPLIDSNNVSIDYPDVDNMPRSTMFYIQPDMESLETASLTSDLAAMETTIYIIAKKDQQEKLIEKVFIYYTSLYLLLRQNQSLDNFVDFIEVYNMDYYPAVTAQKNTVAIEVSLRIQWEKDWMTK